MIKITSKFSDKEEFLNYLGEGIHTAFRKASDSKEASKIHNLISDMDEKEWGHILDFIGSGFEFALITEVNDNGNTDQ